MEMLPGVRRAGRLLLSCRGFAVRRVGFSILLVLALNFSSGCIFSSVVDGIDVNRKDLSEFGISLAYPGHWDVRRGNFFHFTAGGSINGYSDLTLEYRGLPKRLKTRRERAEYADGWYLAFEKSYQKMNWEFVSRQHDTVDAGDTFRFVGRYQDPQFGNMVKLGVLRFRNNRLHAVYYTAPAEAFEDVLPLFVHLDKRHLYFPAE